MNPGEEGWFAQLKKDSKTFDFSGTLGEVIKQVMANLISTEPRNRAAPLNFEINIRNAPITEESIRLAKLIQEVEAGIIDSPPDETDHRPNESWEHYRDRLMHEHDWPFLKATNTARMICGEPDDPAWDKFKKDSLAQTYVRLSANLEAFTNASPADYQIAKNQSSRLLPRNHTSDMNHAIIENLHQTT
jgi:hypothetical protein